MEISELHLRHMLEAAWDAGYNDGELGKPEAGPNCEQDEDVQYILDHMDDYKDATES